MKYVLTGVTGALGSQVFKYLLRLVPGKSTSESLTVFRLIQDIASASDIIVSLYNPHGASPAVVNSGVEIRRGNFTDPASLDTAFAGADKVFIVSDPSMAHESRVRAHINAIEAAKRSGATHVYYTSLAFGGGTSESLAGIMQAHLDTERYLAQSGLTYTVLREGIYSEAYLVYLGFFDPKEGNDEVLIPHGDGPVAWVSREDLGEATARIIVQGGYENQTLLLTGSQALTLKEVADMLSKELGRKITVRNVSEDEFVRFHVEKSGRQEQRLRFWARTYLALQRGEAGVVDPLIRQVLGREPTPFEVTLREGLSGPE